MPPAPIALPREPCHPAPSIPYLQAVAPAPAKPAAEAKAEGKEDVSPFSSAGPPKEDGGKEGEPSPSGYDFDKDSGRIRRAP